MFFQRVRQTAAPLDILLNRTDDFGKSLVFLLLGQKIKALNQREAGIDHRGEDAAEHHYLLFFYASGQKRQIFQKVLRLLAYIECFKSLPS